MTVQELDAQIQSDPDMKQLATDDPTEFTSQVNQLYHRFGYDKFGGPLPLVQKGIGKLSRATGVPESSIRGAAAMGVNIAGTVAGGILGARGGVGGAVGGAMLGSLAAGESSKAIGLTDERDTTDRAMDLAAPLLGPFASKIGKGVAKVLPGSGYALHELAEETMETSLKGMRVTKGHLDKAFYDLARVPDFHFIKPTKLLGILDDELASASKQASLKIPGTTTVVTQLTALRDAVSKNQTIKYSDLMALSKGFNKLKETNPSDTVWKRASHAIIEDLEIASTNPKLSQNTRDKATAGLTAFRKMVSVNKAYNATNSLDALAKRVVTPSTGDPSLHRFDVKAFNKGLEQNTDIKDAFSPAEIKSMKDAVADLGYLMSTTASPANLGAATVAGGVGGGIASLSGAGYASTGMAAIGASAAYAALASAVKSEAGRKAIKYMATEGKGKVNIRELQSILGSITAGAASGLQAGIKAPSEGAIHAFENQP